MTNEEMWLSKFKKLCEFIEKNNINYYEITCAHKELLPIYLVRYFSNTIVDKFLLFLAHRAASRSFRGSFAQLVCLLAKLWP